MIVKNSHLFFIIGVSASVAEHRAYPKSLMFIVTLLVLGITLCYSKNPEAFLDKLPPRQKGYQAVGLCLPSKERKSERHFRGPFYVTDQGSYHNDGTSEVTAWSLLRAVSSAAAGDTVFVKSGIYEQPTLKFRKSGISGKSIVFIGYRQKPGDILTEKYGTMNYGDNITEIGFPVINPTQQQALYVLGDFIELHNIAVYDDYKDANHGILIDGNHNILNNIAFADIGPRKNTSVGAGIFVRGNHNLVMNSYGENCDGIGYIVQPRIDGKGNHNVFKNNEYYSDNLAKMTDYYFAVSYRGHDLNTASRNLFEGNRGYRMHNGSHEGHGLTNAGGSHNLWRNNTIHRTKIEIRYPSSTGTIFDGNTISGDENGSVSIEQGATNIHIRNGYYICDYAALIFTVKKYDPIVSSKSPSNIKVYNNIFIGGKRMINMGAGSEETSPCIDIDIHNNIFDGQSGGLFYYNNGNTMTFRNNIVVNSTSRKWVTIDSGSLAIKGENNLFYNNSFKPPTSGFHANINANPLFKNSGTMSEQYKLKRGSPAIDAGVELKYRTSDFNGKTIENATDIGPFEY